MNVSLNKCLYLAVIFNSRLDYCACCFWKREQFRNLVGRQDNALLFLRLCSDLDQLLIGSKNSARQLSFFQTGNLSTKSLQSKKRKTKKGLNVPNYMTNFGFFELRTFPRWPCKVEVGTFYPFTVKVGSKYTYIILEGLVWSQQIL